MVDCRDAFAMIAVQGPGARAILGALADGPLPPRMHCGERTVAGVPLLFCGTGYTGEEGAELLCDPLRAGELWDALLAAGVVPAGLGARDTLRLEACFPLYGNELSPDRTPDRGRPGLGLPGADRLHRRRADRRRAGGGSRASGSSPS